MSVKGALPFTMVLLFLAPGASGPPAASAAPSGKAAPAVPKGKTTPPASQGTKPPAASQSPAAAPGGPARAATFSFVCATPAVLLPPPVKQIVTQLMRAHQAAGAHPWGDRAVSLRLRSDHAPVYFVPLACGSTGSCTWGIVDAGPAKSLGVFAGAVVRVETGGSGWPPVQVFTSGADGQTRLETWKLIDGQYRAQAAAAKPAVTTVAQLQSCFDNASCCPRQGGLP